MNNEPSHGSEAPAVARQAFDAPHSRPSARRPPPLPFVALSHTLPGFAPRARQPTPCPCATTHAAGVPSLGKGFVVHLHLGAAAVNKLRTLPIDLRRERAHILKVIDGV